jgi:hypothetical protein
VANAVTSRLKPLAARLSLADCRRRHLGPARPVSVPKA